MVTCEVDVIWYRLTVVERNIDHALDVRDRRRFHQLCEMRRQLKAQLHRELQARAMKE